MKWLRSNIRHGARLALFAVLVQFVLTFGHSHAFVHAATLAQTSLQQSGSGEAAAATDRAAIQKSAPAGSDREHFGHDHCAICTVVAMAAAVVSATPPVLLLPQAIELLQLATDAEFVHLKSAGEAFQPRAPPAS